NSVSILVVERSVDFGACISIALDATRFESSVVRSRYEAVQELRRGNTFDLMLTDWSMPGISPELFTRWVSRYSPKTSVIAMSADPYMEIDAKAAGIAYWLLKPFTPEC